MKRLFNLLTFCFIVPVAGLAQEGTWTLSAGAGYALISLGAVKGDMERDVSTYYSGIMILGSIGIELY